MQTKQACNYLDENFCTAGNEPGGIEASLLEAIESECNLKRIRLSDPSGSTPKGLTPAMENWYMANVAYPRVAALEEINRAYQNVEDDKGTSAVFLEGEQSRLQDTRIREKRAALKQMQQAHNSDFTQLEEAGQKLEEKTALYDEMRSEYNGREAKLTPWWYIPALIIVLITETLVNYESFNAVKLFTPALALGSTLIIGIALALASHMHGTVLRQYKSLAGRHRKNVDRATGWRMAGLGTVCLAVVMAAVWYARSQYFAGQLISFSVLGGQAPSALTVIGGSMIMNVVVWIVGVIIAFVAHDEDHFFPLTLKEKRAAEKEVEQLSKKIEKIKRAEYGRINEDIDVKISKLQSKNRVFKPADDMKDEYEHAQQMLRALKEQDQRILSILNNYRLKLIEALGEKKCKFALTSELKDVKAEIMDPIDYKAYRLSLNYHTEA
ncbi:hypothetical protein [Flexibacterium corallicola]|uniref:hypothetical protein n=1 Tax=Flexibacterium corallicola TaxID=3037259 RepID=UPI00286F2576|nr:hypothetical protein [Pseudovibrio sp. M1P-2-3]